MIASAVPTIDASGQCPGAKCIRHSPRASSERGPSILIPSGPNSLARLDPIHDTRADRHALRQRHLGITQLRRRAATPAIRSTARPRSTPNPKARPPSSVSGCTSIRREPPAASQPVTAGMLADFSACRRCSGLRSRRCPVPPSESARTVAVSGPAAQSVRQRQKRQHREHPKDSPPPEQPKAVCFDPPRLQNRPRHGSWLGSAGTPQNVSSTSVNPSVGNVVADDREPIPLRACAPDAPSTTASGSASCSPARTRPTGPLPA